MPAAPRADTAATDRITLKRVPALALLCDHLSAALDHADALLALPVPSATNINAGATVPALLRQNREVDRLARDLRGLELAITMRLMQARTCAAEAKRQDASFDVVAQLIRAGTAVIADIGATANGSAQSHFDTGCGAAAFLTSRCAMTSQTISLNEGYLVHGGLPLGLLMDFCATALDKIDAVMDQAADVAA